MITTQDKVAGLYAAFFNRAPDKAGFDEWVTKLDAGTATLEDIAAGFAEHATFESTYGDMDTQAFVEAVYQNVLGQAGDAAGIADQVAALTDGTYATRADFVAGFVESALTIDLDTVEGLTADELTAATARQDTLVNKVTAAQYFITTWGDATNVADAANPETDANYLASIAALAGIDDTEASVTAAETAIDAMDLVAPVEPVDPGVEGEDFFLTTSVDALEGTADDDTFYADLNQVAYTGAVANTLATGDRIDGGAGTDTLEAQLTTQTVTMWSNSTDAQPRTTDVEKVTIEAQDFNTAAPATGGGYAYLDAKNMTGIDSIGSLQSDGDLVIENLTTLTDAGVARNTEDLTITMDHTDNFNSDNDASDLTVYFDEDYLLAGQTKTASQANYWLLDEESEDYVTQPLLNIERDGVTLTIDGVAYTIAMDTDVAAAADTWVAFAAGLQAVIDASDEAAFEGLTVVVDETNTDSTFNDAGDNVTIPAITIVDSQGRSLVPTGFVSPADATGAFDIYGDYDNVASTAVNQKVTINVELEKVGREGEGGNLIIGGKELDSDAGNFNQGNGIDTFNISVLGDESKLSNLGLISSTNGDLRTVNISTADTTLDDFASLTVRDSFGGTLVGGTLDRLDADAFLGDLTIGEDVAAVDINSFTATGGGDVTLWETINAGVAASVTTGAGVDDINITNAGSVTVATGSANDTIDVDMTAATANANINGGGNDDTITVDYATGSTKLATTVTTLIDGAEGEDTITTNLVKVNVDGGAGNDAIYTDNTGSKAEFLIANGNFSTSTAANSTVLTATAGEIDFLYNAQVQVTLETSNVAGLAFTNGFESALVTIKPDTGYLTTQADVNNAIVEAINEDETLQEIAKAEIVNGGVEVTYLVDGLQSATSIKVDFFAATLTAAEITAIEKEFSDTYNDSDYFTVTAPAQTAQTLNTAATVVGNADVSAYKTAVGGAVQAVYTVDLTGASTGGAGETITVDGVVVYTSTALQGTPAAIAGDAAGYASSVTIDGILYNVTTGATSIILTQATATDLTISSTPLNVAGTAALPSVPFATGTDGTAASGTAGSDSVADTANIVNGGLGDDVIVLSSDDAGAASNDVIEFTGYNQGMDTIVHFDTTIDTIDLSAYLTNTLSASNSSESQVDIAATVTSNGFALEANSVTVSTLTAAGLDTAAANDFGSLTAAQVEAALETVANGFTTVATANLYGTTSHSILILENNEAAGVGAQSNAGEYKIFEVSYDNGATGAGLADFTVKLVGGVDVGDNAFVVEGDITA